jgi:hypothetical protein
MDSANIDPIFTGNILPQAEWQARVESLSGLEARQLRERCERFAIECAMLAKYIGHRRFPTGDQGHNTATREMEETRRAVKRALRYDFPRE